jgi:hypothetical protein
VSLRVAEARSRAARCFAIVLPIFLGVRIDDAVAYDKRECVSASDEGQALRIDGRLLRARDRFLVCADPSCPALVRTACTQWAGELEQLIPSIVLTVREPDGHDAVGVTASSDGTPLPEAGAGRAIPIDPGQHTLRVSVPDGRVVERVLVAKEGEQRRRIEVLLPEPLHALHAKTEPPAAPASSVPWAAWGTTVVAAAAWTSFGIFAISGHSQYQHLRDTCGTSCDSSQYPSTVFVAADVSLGVAVVATGIAAYLFLSHHPADRRSAATPPWVVAF